MIELTGRKGDVSHLAFSPDGRVLGTSGGGRQLELWDVATGNQWGRHTGMAFGDGPVHFHPTRPRCFAAYMHGVAEIATDTKKGRMLVVENQGINFFWTGTMLPDGAGFVFHCNGSFYHEGAVWRLRWTARKMLQFVWAVKVGRGAPRLVRATPDGESVVSLDAARAGGVWSIVDAPARVTVRSVADGNVTQWANVPPATTVALAVAPDSQSFVTCHANNLCVWDLRNLKAVPRKVRADTRSHLTAVAYHPSGRYLAVTSNDATVRLYDTATWTVARAFTWNIGRMRGVAFSPDGTLAAAGSDTGKAAVWDVDV